MRAVASSLATTLRALARVEVLRSDCHQRVATPATCGVAMLVPLSVRRPPPAWAERTPTPGALTSGRVFENGATTKPLADWPSATTATTPSAAAGMDTAIS